MNNGRKKDQFTNYDQCSNPLKLIFFSARFSELEKLGYAYYGQQPVLGHNTSQNLSFPQNMNPLAYYQLMQQQQRFLQACNDSSMMMSLEKSDEN